MAQLLREGWHARRDEPEVASCHERLSSGALLRVMRKERPDAIVCTHFLPAELLMRERDRQRLDCPVWLQVADYNLHNMWLVPGMAG